MQQAVPILILALGLLACSVEADEQLLISDPWSPLAPPGRMMAGFMQLTNQGAEPVVLVAAASEHFERVEFHQTSMDDGVMRMRRIESLRVEPGQTVELRSGGYHLMLIGPRQQFRNGDEIAIELIGRGAARWSVNSIVRPR